MTMSELTLLRIYTIKTGPPHGRRHLGALCACASSSSHVIGHLLYSAHVYCVGLHCVYVVAWQNQNKRAWLLKQLLAR